MSEMTNRNKTIPVLEIFGPTIQGEGMVIGRKTMFVRTAGCDYSCEWCDSAFTWDGSAKEDIRQMTPEQIWNALKEQGGDRFSHVTISGGNPALLSHLGDLLILLKEKGCKIALETQGSRWQEWFYDIDDLTLSPKPPSSGMNTNFDILDEIVTKLQAAKRNFSIKIVIFNDEDFQYSKKVYKRYRGVPFYLQVGNEHLITEDNEMLLAKLINKYEWLIDKTMDCSEMNAVSVLPQLHTYVWGNKRGV